MHKKIAIALALGIMACGGGSNWVDPTTGSFSPQDSTDVLGMFSTAFGAATGREPGPQVPAQPGSQLGSSSTAIHSQAACATSGTVSVDGTMSSSCSSQSSCSFSGNVRIALSSCGGQNGTVGNGNVDVSVSGSESSTQVSFNETLRGAITVTRGGATVGTCGINVSVSLTSSASTSTVKVTGTVCGHAVDQ
jgi:hypothetical protein